VAKTSKKFRGDKEYKNQVFWTLLPLQQVSTTLMQYGTRVMVVVTSALNTEPNHDIRIVSG